MLARQVAVRTMDGGLRTVELGTPEVILVGGAKGQALTKSSNEDGDFGWEDMLSMDQVKHAVETEINKAMGDIGAVLDAINGEVI